jgi:outer membrane protein assembly factor BamE (lipoprotein component of BamABCDE complex)
MKSWIVVVLALGCVFWLVACDRQGNPIEQAGLDQLAKGISSEAEVRTVMGQPDTVWEEDNGARTLEYPKGPMGHRTWMFEIDQYGKLQDYKQVLTTENFARIQPGMSQDAVRRLLGKPRTVAQFKLKKEEVWDWRYLQSTNQGGLFNVHFDMASHQVTHTSASDDGGGH